MRWDHDARSGVVLRHFTRRLNLPNHLARASPKVIRPLFCLYSVDLIPCTEGRRYLPNFAFAYLVKEQSVPLENGFRAFKGAERCTAPVSGQIDAIQIQIRATFFTRPAVVRIDKANPALRDQAVENTAVRKLPAGMQFVD